MLHQLKLRYIQSAKANPAWVILLLVAILAIGLRLIGSSIFQIPATVYITVLLAFATIIAARKFHFTILTPFWGAFIIVALISIIVNRPPIEFQAWQRLLAFTITTLAIGPAITSPLLSRFRHYLWNAFMIGFLIVALISIIMLIIETLQTGELPSPFGGIYGHRMASALTSVIPAIWLIYLFINYKYHIALQIPIVVIALGCLLLTCLGGSRIALLSGTIAIIYLIISANHQCRPRVYAFLCVIAGCTLLLFIPAIRHTVLSVIEHKFIIGNVNDSIIFSRDTLWSARLLEFRASPIVGVGFASETLNTTLFDIFPYVPSLPGIIEPGSAYLSILSQTGVLGAICLLPIFILPLLPAKITSLLIPGTSRPHTASNTYHPTSHKSRTLYKAVFIFLLFVGITEGYLLAVGNTFCLLFWLTTTLIYNGIFNSLNHKSNN